MKHIGCTQTNNHVYTYVYMYNICIYVYMYICIYVYVCIHLVHDLTYIISSVNKKNVINRNSRFKSCFFVEHGLFAVLELFSQSSIECSLGVMV